MKIKKNLTENGRFLKKNLLEKGFKSKLNILKIHGKTSLWKIKMLVTLFILKNCRENSSNYRQVICNRTTISSNEG